MQQSRKRQSKICKLRNLIHAIKSQDEDYIDNLTTENFNINGNYVDDGTPLHVAARIGNYKIFQKLIKLGADIHNRHPTTQETVLHSAVKFSNYDIVRYLIENGVDVNVKLKNYGHSNGETALHIAATTGTKEVMKLLSRNNPDIDAESDDGITPFISAIKAENYDAMAALLECTSWYHRYEDDDYNKKIFHAAVDTLVENCLVSFSDKIDINNKYNSFSFFESQISLHYVISLDSNNRGIIPYQLGAGYSVRALEIIDYLIIQLKSKSEKNLRCSLAIKWHNAKLTAADFYICDRNISTVSTMEGLDDYIAERILEVEKMTKNVIEGSNIKFIEVLRKNVRYLAHYLKLVDFENIFKRERQFPEYPIYQNKIFFKLSRIHTRVNFLKYSEKVINNIFYELQLPDTFIRELLVCLSNDDLKKIVQPSKKKKEKLINSIL